MGYEAQLSGALVLVLFFYYLLTAAQLRRAHQKQAKLHGCKPAPKYPHKDPFLGLDFLVDAISNIRKLRFLDGWRNLFRKYGHTFSGNDIGGFAVYTVDPKNLQAVHSLKFQDYGVQPVRRAPTLPFLGEGIFTMDGPVWEHSRALIRTTFARSNIANLPAFEIHFRKFFDLLPRDGSTVDLKPLLYRLFLDTSTEFLFGESLDSLCPEMTFRAKEFLSAFHYAQRGMGIRVLLGKLRIFYYDRKWHQSNKIAHDIADGYVNKALRFRQAFLEAEQDNKTPESGDSKAESNHRYILLQEIAKETDNREDLRNQILHIFLAGHDSSAITLTNAFFHLSRHPDKWEKLHAEVNSAKVVTLTFEILKSLQYLQSVVKETLRLHPVAPMDTRIAYRDTILPTGGGPDGKSPVFIPEGTKVTTSYEALQRLAPCFQPDPDTFRPERWETLKPGWAFIPFGGGPRMCPGHQLASTEVAYVLARMAQEWRRIECRDEVMEWVEMMKVSASSRNGAKVGLILA